MSVQRFNFGLALVAGLVLVASSVALRAADKPAEKKADKPKAEQADDAKGDDKEEAKEEAKDRYALPEGGVKELLAFVKETMAIRPTTQAEFQEHRTKGRAAMMAAAEKVQEIAKPEDRQLEGFSDAEGLLLMFRAAEARTASAEDRQKLIADIKTHLANYENPSSYASSAAMQVAMGLEYGPASSAAVEVYRDLGAVLAGSKNAQVAKTGEKMEGAARRLSLVGNAMEVSGTEMDGSKFDWSKLRGKVVLVDFWATWCGPCIGELPNVKKNYELYHDKGFEVVAISLDRDRQKLEEFLKREQNPWITLHDGDWSDNSVATYYGVMGIPTVILVDQEGKVVSTRARGPELGRHLEKLLGPAEPKEPAKEDAAEKDKADAATK